MLNIFVKLESFKIILIQDTKNNGFSSQLNRKIKFSISDIIARNLIEPEIVVFECIQWLN